MFICRLIGNAAIDLYNFFREKMVSMDEVSELKRSIEAVVIAIGREESTHEFYEYLAGTIRHEETRAFFRDIVLKEDGDIKHTEKFLAELEDDLRGVNNDEG